MCSGSSPSPRTRQGRPGRPVDRASPALWAGSFTRGVLLDELTDCTVDLWFAQPEDWADPAAMAAALAVLGPEELARWENRRSPEDRRLFGVSHWLVRESLSRYEDRPPAAWRFLVNDHGKPRIDPAAGPSPLAFSLAHTRGLAVVAVAKRMDLGVDCERQDRTVDAAKLIQRFYTLEERRALEPLAPEVMTHRFFLHWTLKEATLKALGTGLSPALSTIAFRLTGDGPSRIDPLGMAKEENRWHWAVLTPLMPYVAAIGILAAPGKTVTLRTCRALPWGKAEPLKGLPLALSHGVVYGKGHEQARGKEA